MFTRESKNDFDLKELLDYPKEFLEIKEQFIKNFMINNENMNDNDYLKKMQLMQKGNDQILKNADGKDHHLELNSMKFEFKDSIFFKTFKKHVSSKKIKNSTEQTNFTTIQINNDLTQYSISCSKNFPQIKAKINFEGDLTGFSSKEVNRYFCNCFDVFIQKCLKLSSNTLEKNQNDILPPLFQTIQDFSTIIIENVYFFIFQFILCKIHFR